MRIRVLIVDDHAAVRQGLHLFLGQDPAIEIIGEAGDGEAALAVAADLHPDVVLMDLVMPGMDGLQATAAIRRELPGTQVLALTSVVSDDLATEAICAGAVGLLYKDAGAQDLRRAIKQAAAGQSL